MIVVERYSEEKKVEWDQFCKTSKNPLFMFQRDYMDYHKDRFQDHSLMFYNDDELIALLPMNEKGEVLNSHRGLTYGGFITGKKMKQHTMNECFEVCVNYVKNTGFKELNYKVIPHIYHVQPAEEDRYSLFIHNAELVKVEPSTVLNLKEPLKMPKGRKAQISRARREGVEIRELTSEEDFHNFIALENAVLSSRHNTQAVHTGAELSLLHSRFPEQIHLFGASKDGELIAGTIVYEYGQVVHTQYMAANEIAREIGALDLAVSAVIEKYRDSKRWLDFGISTENGGRYLNDGLISQKEGFGGRTNVYEMWKLNIG